MQLAARSHLPTTQRSKKTVSFLKDGPAMGQSIGIKFVRRYGRDIHSWCAEQGFAPKLMGPEELPVVHGRHGISR